MSRQVVNAIGLMLIVAGILGPSAVRLRASDLVSATLFPESVLAKNGPRVLRDANQLLPDERFETLVRWVLPTKLHGFRVQGWFSDSRVRKRDPVQGNRLLVGGEPESTSLALVRSAVETGRQKELTQKIAGASAPTQADRRSQAALLALLALETESPNHCLAPIEALLDHSDQPLHDCWPELLVAQRLSQMIANAVSETTPDIPVESLESSRAAMEELLLELQPKARADSDSVEAAHLLRLLSEIRGFRRSVNNGKGDADEKRELRNWHAVDRVGETSLSSGRPLGRWETSGGQVTCTSSHECESLYYAVPLRGDFQVEAEVSSSPFARGHFAWGGDWVAVSDINQVRTGGYSSEDQPIVLPQPLTEMDEWSRYRMVVKDQIVSVWWNGRLVQQYSVTQDCDPWLSMRNSWMDKSRFRNVRITGNPTIPTKINLLSGSDLRSWKSFHSSDSWRQTDGADGELVSDRIAEFRSGVYAPSLLYYHRPVLEDGEIGYEFFYELQTSIVHPAIGDTVLLIDESSVRLHRTDQAGSRIESLSAAPAKKLSLHVGQWNKAVVSFVGDTAKLLINGQAVKTLELSSSNRRTFGLFHFADQTDARVRDITWKGSWATQLPALADQELAESPHECLAGLEGLTEWIKHDFAALGVPKKRFNLVGGTVNKNVEEEFAGVRVTPVADGTWRRICLQLATPIYGDFDATLSFEELRFQFGTSDYLDMELRAIDSSGQEFKATRQKHKSNQHFYAKLDQQMPDGEWATAYKGLRDESTSGRLRLIRRGDMCHMLISHQDSPNFHWCGSQPMLSADSVVRLEVFVKNAGGGSTSVLLKSLLLRSNSQAEAKNRDLRISGLETYLHRLKDVNSRTFSVFGIPDFDMSGHAVVTDDGLVTTSPGATQSSVLTWKPPVQGDFDVSVTLNAEELRSGNAALQFSISDQQQMQVDLSALADGNLRIGSDVLLTDDEPVVIRRGPQFVDLRLIRIQKTVFLIYSHDGKTRLLGSHDFSDKPGQFRLATQSREGPASVTWVKFRRRLGLES
ncbi:DUF1583 domain-containing protein [Stieleria marina]|uniref:Uncharacterized protein n=1 Tax=Stieleria marina TaxID=1930275 RepID=A0A517NPL8_9BACT|nr:hypothetical protein K239x_10150 [Planctomycetes bacterium K23_9]